MAYPSIPTITTNGNTANADPSVQELTLSTSYKVYRMATGALEFWVFGNKTVVPAGPVADALWRTLYNDAPVVNRSIPDQVATVAAVFDYVVPTDTFRDADNDTLTYAATLANDSALPAWLTFTPSTRTFHKDAAAGSAGTISIKVTVTDENSNTASDTFDLVVS